ncbi:methylated-DNA--[protein]-cysteine S-methyltransferase [Marinobacter sp.]|uniref:methylated-DNA--[protein]-cysteine S-methyltransferase n=1 Tax=Marinobacter sp. TaxID=50741 RepID=UPI00384E8BC8
MTSTVKSQQLRGPAGSQFSEHRKREALHFAFGTCSLGVVLVASTRQGICSILLGDDPAALMQELKGHFRTTNVISGGPGLERQVAAVVDLVEAPCTASALPLDIRGTPFQQQVWKALRTIPAGQTVSYTELAHRIGSPSAFRAVAGACAANPLAVAVPCHRVVRKDGGLSGYRWGVVRKQALLEREKRMSV